jgi:eukaryotic-like serine/threonine-protein kinase
MGEGADQRARKRVGSLVRGKYHVDSFLAAGSMASVFSATHRNGSRVALKILHPHLARDPGILERFRREGYFANSIGHPGVVRAIDDDVTEDGCAFLVMELLEGETLEEARLREGGRLPLPFVLGVSDAVLDVLTAAHERGVVHRDLKPENVFLTSTSDVKVLDFGVARWDDGQTSSDMTGVGMVLGTPAYMPPEQALGRREEVDARSDLWALGATLFVALSGEAVHGGGDAKAKLIATARTPARKLYEVAPDVPRAVASVIDRALAFDRRERWETAAAMREALRWARVALEDAVPFAHDARRNSGLPPSTLRSTDDEPTLTGRSIDVVTSAPSLRPRELEARSFDRTKPSQETAPQTERMPHGAPDALGSSPPPGLGPTGDPVVDRPTAPADAPPSSVSSPGSFTSPRFFPLPAPPGATLPGTGPPPPGAPSSTSSVPVTHEELTPERTGPLLAQIVPQRRTNPAAIAIPILVGFVAVLGGYVAFVRSNAPEAAVGIVGAEPATEAPPEAKAAPAPPASDAPSLPTTGTAPGPPPAEPEAEPARQRAAEGEPAAESEKRPRIRRKARPSAAAVSTPPATDAPASLGTDAPAPPAPAPEREPYPSFPTLPDDDS